MTKDEIEKKAQEIQNEINDISMLQAATRSGQIELFTQVQRISQDLAALIKYLARL